MEKIPSQCSVCHQVGIVQGIDKKSIQLHACHNSALGFRIPRNLRDSMVVFARKRVENHQS